MASDLLSESDSRVCLMLRWFNSDAVFWPFMLGITVMLDIFIACHVVTEWPKEIGGLIALSLVTPAVILQCLRVQKNQR